MRVCTQVWEKCEINGSQCEDRLVCATVSHKQHPNISGLSQGFISHSRYKSINGQPRLSSETQYEGTGVREEGVANHSPHLKASVQKQFLSLLLTFSWLKQVWAPPEISRSEVIFLQRGVLLKEPATSVQTGGKQRCKATWGSSWHADRQTVVMGLEETKARVVFIILVWSYAMLCF